MKIRFLLACTLAPSIALLPAAVSAQQAPQVKVQVDDLDLTKDAGVKTANNRLKHGVDGQCAASGQDLHSVMGENACRKDLLTSGRNKIAAAAAKSDADKLAEERHLSEVSIHPRHVRRATAYRRTPGRVVVVRDADRPARRHPSAPHHASAPHHPSAPHKAVHHATKAPHKKKR